MLDDDDDDVVAMRDCVCSEQEIMVEFGLAKLLAKEWGTIRNERQGRRHSARVREIERGEREHELVSNGCANKCKSEDSIHFT